MPRNFLHDPEMYQHAAAGGGRVLVEGAPETGSVTFCNGTPWGGLRGFMLRCTQTNRAVAWIGTRSNGKKSVGLWDAAYELCRWAEERNYEIVEDYQKGNMWSHRAPEPWGTWARDA